MNLRLQAETDLGNILADAFGWNITVVNPEGASLALKGFSNDISSIIDPNTGMLISGRLASVALRISSLGSLGMPYGIENKLKKPWVVKFNDLAGNSQTFKVIRSNPDRGLGLITLILEAYVTVN